MGFNLPAESLCGNAFWTAIGSWQWIESGGSGGRGLSWTQLGQPKGFSRVEAKAGTALEP
jgi:hypothetical protein